MSAKIPDADVRAASELAEEFGDIIGRELPTLEGVELMGANAEERAHTTALEMTYFMRKLMD